LVVEVKVCRMLADVTAWSEMLLAWVFRLSWSSPRAKFRWTSTSICLSVFWQTMRFSFLCPWNSLCLAPANRR